MNHLSEIESYAKSFAEEIRSRFRDDILSAANGLATTHAIDSEQVEVLLWSAILEQLGPEPVLNADNDLCFAADD